MNIINLIMKKIKKKLKNIIKNIIIIKKLKTLNKKPI